MELYNIIREINGENKIEVKGIKEKDAKKIIKIRYNYCLNESIKDNGEIIAHSDDRIYFKNNNNIMEITYIENEKK